MASRFSAVLLDMDGVLVDSMGAHVTAWLRVCEELGIEMTEDELYRREGETPEKSARDFIKRSGVMLTKARVKHFLTRVREEFYSQPVPRLFSGATELLDRLSGEGYALGLVTGSRRIWVDKIMSSEMQRMFQVIISAEDVRHGKPNPEPYLAAMLRIGAKPQQSVVIENAPFGIQSAKAAGAYVIAVKSYLSDQDLHEADELIEDIRDIPTLLEGD